MERAVAVLREGEVLLLLFDVDSLEEETPREFPWASLLRRFGYGQVFEDGVR